MWFYRARNTKNGIKMKHIKLYEEFLNESIKFKDLIDTRFGIEVGSGTQTGTWNESDLND